VGDQGIPPSTANSIVKLVGLTLHPVWVFRNLHSAKLKERNRR